MEQPLPDHYATLGLHRGCTINDIKSSFRILSKAHHPDVNGSSPESMARTQAINEAYRVLGDETRRAEYDAELKQCENEHASRGPVPTIKQDVMVALPDLFRGVTMTVEVRDPSHPEGYETYPLVIPPDTAPGIRFRIKRNAPFDSGRVEVRVKMRPDRFFKARGSDLRYDLNIPARRAESGGHESIRGATGSCLSITIPARVKRGEILRIRGEGLPKPRGGRGDLLVRVMYRPDVRVTRGENTPKTGFRRRRLLS